MAPAPAVSQMMLPPHTPPFVLAGAALEEVVLDQAETVRETQAAQAKADRLGAVPARAGEVMEVVVVNPHTLRDLAARSAHIDHAAEGALVAELVAIHLRVMAGDRQISALAHAFEEVAGKADVSRAGPDLIPGGDVGEQESFNLDVGGGAGHVEAVRTGDLHAADGLRDDPDWIGRGPGAVDRDRSASCVDAVM